jgi:hypothetical protein
MIDHMIVLYLSRLFSLEMYIRKKNSVKNCFWVL